MLYTRMHNSQSSPNCAEVPTASESDDRFEMAPLLLPSTLPRSSLADTAAILLANHRQSVATTMVLTDNVAHRPLLFHKRPQKQRLFTESNTGNLSASLHGLSSIHRPSSSSSRSAGYSGPLERRHNKSCDWSPPNSHNENGGMCGMCGAGCREKSGLGTFLPQNDAISLRSFNNPIAQVSSDILRVSGYTNQFKNLLTTRSRRESGPGGLAGCQQTSLEEKCNGDVRFDLTDQEANAGHTAAEGGSISVDAIRKNTLTHRAIRRRQSGYGISITSESTAKMRCKMRKQYFMKRNRVCDLSLLLGLVGLILVVIDSELTALRIISKHSPASLTLRGLCVLSTLLLVASLINYHCIEVKIALIDSGADDWRVALTTERIIKLAIEIAVCGLCPFPGSGTISWPHISSSSDEHEITMVHVPFDVILSVPMFLRSYLLCRFMVLHSKQFQDAATRSIAALNRISMDFRFVIKTMMADHPLTVLVVFTVSYWICMSWMFTQCERYDTRYENHFASDTQKHYYLNSLWFIMVTFMSIGYGDVVPHSYCGRLLSITTGIVGAGVSSALIAVISRKLELSRAEKHVNNFMSDSKLTNQRKNAAAAVLQHTWFIHKYQRSIHKGDDLRLRQHQRKFLNAINDFRRIKWDQRKLQEKGNSLLDVGKLHNEMHETLWEMHRTQDQFITQIDMLTQRIVELQAAVLGTQGGQMQQLTHKQSIGSPNPTYHNTPATSSPSTQLRQLCAGNQHPNMNSSTPPPMHLRVPGDTGIQAQTHQKQPELRRNVSLAHTPVSNTLDSPPIILNNGSPDNAAYGSFPSLQKFSTPLTMRRIAATAQQNDSVAGSPSVTSAESRHLDNRCSRKSTISAPTAVIINSDEEHDENSASTPLISRDN